ncbi:biotin/lipoyl-containing protein [Kitasatospora sp. NPDC058218]|uniref:biotin/lipoyl-containing protein n=1 Tax=Kitasatospora sp. NPDC058218 TaxID=3346385 RepID=UPI0036DEC9DC
MPRIDRVVPRHKRVGGLVKRDDDLIDVETDKAVLETPSPADGIVVQIIATDGATVAVDQILASIDTDASLVR